MSVRRRVALLALALVGGWLPWAVGSTSAAEPVAVEGHVTAVVDRDEGRRLEAQEGLQAFFGLPRTTIVADDWAFTFGGPGGSALRPGTYPGATNDYANTATTPFLEVRDTTGSDCTTSGSFTVLDAGPERLWVQFEQRCPGSPTPLVGEVRVGSAYVQDDLRVAAGAITWPEHFPGQPARSFPVRVANPGPAPLVPTATITAGAQDFTVDPADCAAELAPGASCVLEVGFAPSRPGSRVGLLEVGDSAGHVREVRLAGRGTPGTTRWQVSGEPGEYVSDGRTWTYDQSDGTTFTGTSGPARRVNLNVQTVTGTWWDATFSAPVGELLEAGRTYTGAVRNIDSTPGVPGLEVTGDGRGCSRIRGEFTVHEIAYDAGVPTGWRISFEQYCDSNPLPLRGEVAWRAVGESDTAAPDPVGDVELAAHDDVVDLSWRDPSSSDWAATRVLGGPDGAVLYAGRQGSVTLRDVPRTSDYVLTLVSEDESGNLGVARQAVVPALTTDDPTPTDDPTTTPPSPPSSSPTPTTTPSSTPPSSAPPAPTTQAPTPPAPTTQAQPEQRTVHLAATRRADGSVRFVATAGPWADGARGVLQRRVDGDWHRVIASRLDDRGRLRLVLERAARGSRYRLRVRADGATLTSPVVQLR